MAIPPEFNYTDEDEFIQRFLIPLLHRLGFVVVANYHRSGGELGKDLVFADIDRFGHIRYSALQAKHLNSIGVNAVSTLVEDCKQAFATPFIHPQTGATERIQTFYAVNAGSISADARTHFFHAVGNPMSACSRVLDGKALLALDRWAAATQSSTVLPDLNGLILEVEYNRRVANVLLPLIGELSNKIATIDPSRVMTDPIAPHHFRTGASGQYVQRPFFVEALPPKDVEAFHQTYNLCNVMLERCTGVTTVGIVSKYVAGLQEYLPIARVLGNRITENVSIVLRQLGPLSASEPS